MALYNSSLDQAESLAGSERSGPREGERVRWLTQDTPRSPQATEGRESNAIIPPVQQSSAIRRPQPTVGGAPTHEFPTAQPSSALMSSDTHYDPHDHTSLLSAHLSHTDSRPVSAAMEESVPIPLLASTFGKRDLASTTSLSSNVGLQSNSSTSGKTSRYPSLAASSTLEQCSGSRDRTVGTDWHNLPAGLSGLKNLQIELPHDLQSSAEVATPTVQGPASGPPDSKGIRPQKRAHLRESTLTSQPDLQRRSISQGIIATIDVVL